MVWPIWANLFLANPFMCCVMLWLVLVLVLVLVCVLGLLWLLLVWTPAPKPPPPDRPQFRCFSLFRLHFRCFFSLSRGVFWLN